MKVTRTLALCFLVFACCDGAKILFLCPSTAYSHYILGHRLLEGLAARGHQVTMVSPFTTNNSIKNYQDVVLTGMREHFDEMVEDNGGGSIFDMTSIPTVLMQFMVTTFSVSAQEFTFEHPNVRKELFGKDVRFDLVMSEQFFNDVFKGFCHYFDAPCVMFATMGSNQVSNYLVANPAPPSYIPDIFMSFGEHMTFWQRAYNLLYTIFVNLLNYLYFFPKQNDLMHRYFPDAPHLSVLQSNVSLVLLNSHVSTNQPVPHVPSMIEVGGMHVKPAGKLPEDLQKYLDDAKEGVVYFSMGSNLQSNEIPEEKRKGILKALSKLKQKVLWKFETELPGKPDNVMIKKWLPQQDILGHPNVKLFISHGGLLSTIEAIYNGVPMIGIPIFGDQKLNMQKSERNGFAIHVPYEDLNEETLTAALVKMTTDNSYTENAKLRSALMHDQPTKPLDRAIYWVEYVLRHNGAPHLQTAAVHLAWYQYLLLDVIIFVVALISLPIIAVVYYVKCRKCKKNKEQKLKTN